MTIIQCALHSPGSGRHLGYFVCVVWIHRNFLEACKVTGVIFCCFCSPWTHSVFEVSFSSIFRFYSGQVFIAYVLFYAMYDHDSMCAALPWFEATSRKLHMCCLDPWKFFWSLQSHCGHVLSTLATLDKSIFEVNFSSIFRFYSPQVFIAYFLFYATYDHDSMCVALPWFGATSRILRMCHLDSQNIFQKPVQSLQTLSVNIGQKLTSKTECV